MPSEYVLQQLERLGTWLRTGESPQMNKGPWGANLPTLDPERKHGYAFEFIAQNIISEINRRDSELDAVFRTNARLSAELFAAEQSLRDSIALTFMSAMKSDPYASTDQAQLDGGSHWGRRAYAFATGVLEARKADMEHRKSSETTTNRSPVIDNLDGPGYSIRCSNCLKLFQSPSRVTAYADFDKHPACARKAP